MCYHMSRKFVLYYIENNYGILLNSSKMTVFNLAGLCILLAFVGCRGQEDGPVVETTYGLVEGLSELDLHGTCMPLVSDEITCINYS